MCKAKVKYGTVFKSLKTMPCIKAKESVHCDKSQFPTAEEVEKRLEEILQAGEDQITAYTKIEAHIKTTKKSKGVVECPVCKGNLHYTSQSNGHIWAKCSYCSFIPWSASCLFLNLKYIYHKNINI